ncbi:unnamed protein product [Lampetra planeri]
MAQKSHGANVASQATAGSRATKRTPGGRGGRQETRQGSSTERNICLQRTPTWRKGQDKETIRERLMQLGRRSSEEEEDDGSRRGVAGGGAALRGPAGGFISGRRSADDERPIGELVGTVAELVAKLDVGQPASSEPGPQGDAATAALQPRNFPPIPADHSSSLASAFKEMATIYDPPSTIRNRFVKRRQGETESPLAFRSALLSLAQAAYSDLGPTGVDSLVLDQLLGLAKELNILLPVTENDNPTSLVIAQCIQSHLGLKKRSGLMACIAPAEETSEEEEATPACAAVTGAGGQQRTTEHHGWRDRPPRLPPRPGSTRGVCFNCGWPGYVAVEFRAPHRGRPGPPSSSPHPPSMSKDPQPLRLPVEFSPLSVSGGSIACSAGRGSLDVLLRDPHPVRFCPGGVPL